MFESLNKIKTTFLEKTIRDNSLNLLIDDSGISLFMFYFSLLSKNDDYYDFAFETLEKVTEEYSKQSVIPASLSKFGWLLSHLNQKEFIETDVEEFGTTYNALLQNNMIKYLKRNNYDFLHGSLGIVLYFLSINKKKADNYISNFVDEFEKKSVKTENNSLKWLSVLDYKTGKKGYNISMSHGIASIIAILSKIYKRGINQVKTKYLLEGAMNFLLQQKLPYGKFVSIFPNLALKNMEQLHSSRLAWCYGDLGISVAIWHASQALGRKDWEEEAVNILLHSAKRRDLKENGVVDAGLCHDTVGIASVWDCYVTLEKHLNTSAEY